MISKTASAVESVCLTEEILQKFDRPGPRYTSYPTAPEWSEAVGEDIYRRHLRDFAQGPRDLSLYVHIPFCESLCYFCGCATAIRPAEEKYGDAYLDNLEREMALVAEGIGTRKILRQLHWGGGSPSFLTEKQSRRLLAVIQRHFDIDLDGDISIEVEPRRATEAKVRAYRDMGFNRISIGIQDFDPRVQEHINRIQPYEGVAEFYRWCRGAGFRSVNFDLIYGLPYQTRDTFRRTVEQVTALRPDRIALYSFAYVPWLRKHQQKLSEADCPDASEKIHIFLEARTAFLAAGYDAIAMDHFALPSDDLAAAFRAGRLYRNFMGYTTRPAQEYIGVGATAIGFLGQGYFQNLKTLAAYGEALAQGRLPVERGMVLSEDDRMRQWVIHQLMCCFRLDRACFAERFGQDFDASFSAEREHLARCAADGLIVDAQGVVQATPLGRLFIRNVCMGFDRYLREGAQARRFSRTV